MGIGCFVTIIAAFIQAFAPKGKIGAFIAGRVLIGMGQGTALSKISILHHKPIVLITFSCWSCIYRRNYPIANPRFCHDLLATVLQRGGLCGLLD